MSDAPRRPDLGLHFSAGMAAGLGLHSLSTAYAPEGVDPLMVAVVGGWTVAGMKEGLDALGMGTPDWLDLWASMLGTLVGVGVSMAVNWAMGAR